jgi:hypothetical protein
LEAISSSRVFDHTGGHRRSPLETLCYFPSLQPIPTQIHGVVYYLTGALLILAPFLLTSQFGCLKY